MTIALILEYLLYLHQQAITNTEMLKICSLCNSTGCFFMQEMFLSADRNCATNATGIIDHQEAKEMVLLQVSIGHIDFTLDPVTPSVFMQCHMLIV